MADDLSTMLTAGAQSAEDEQRLAGQALNALIVDINASVDNPDGNTPVGFGEDNTGIEQAPTNQPQAVDVTADIPGPTTYDTGGSGGLFVPAQQPAALTSEPTAPQDAVLTNPIETGVAPIPSFPIEVPPEAPPRHPSFRRLPIFRLQVTMIFVSRKPPCPVGRRLSRGWRQAPIQVQANLA
jgi:hypothetical protein